MVEKLSHLNSIFDFSSQPFIISNNTDFFTIRLNLNNNSKKIIKSFIDFNYQTFNLHCSISSNIPGNINNNIGWNSYKLYPNTDIKTNQNFGIISNLIDLKNLVLTFNINKAFISTLQETYSANINLKGYSDTSESSILIDELALSIPIINPTYNISPAGANQYSLTSDQSSIYKLRKDTRTGMTDVISSEIRKQGLKYGPQMFVFNEQSGDNAIENGNPSAFASSERIRLIDNMISETMYNTEQILNVMGDAYVQSLYSQIYAKIQNVRTYLNDLVERTVSAAYKNLQRSEELINILQNKINEENMIMHTVPIKLIDLSKIKATLFKTNSTQIYDISNVINYNNLNELYIDFPMIKNNIISSTSFVDYFQPGYIKIEPKSEDITISSHGNNLISFTSPISLHNEDILGGILINSTNQNSYKIINKLNNNIGLLNEEPENVSYLTKFIPNYFESEIIQLNFSGLHNYIPKVIPADITLPKIAEEVAVIVPEAEIIPEPIIVNSISAGIEQNINKGIG